MTKDENTISHPVNDESLKSVSGGVVLLPPEFVTTLEQKDIPNLPRSPK